MKNDVQDNKDLYLEAMGGNSSSVKAQPPVPHNASFKPDHIPGVSEEEFVERGNNNEIKATYKVIEKLGSGAFGQVYKVSKRGVDDKTFALKVIKAAQADDIKLIQQEIKSMVRLKHDSIVGFEHAFVMQKPLVYCILMEFIEGESLQSVLTDRKELPICLVMSLFIQLLEAVAYLHSQGCVHRDLKPANLVVVDGKKLKVVDFGIAFWVPTAQANSVHGYVAGTALYMDPAVLEEAIQNGGRAKTRINALSDIWALGCILYETWMHEILGLIYLKAGANGKAAFIVVQKHLSQLLLTNEMAKFIVPILVMMVVKKDDRSSAKQILDSDIIKGWKAAMSPQIRATITPTTILFFGPFVASIRDSGTPPALRSSNLEFLTGMIATERAIGEKRVLLALLELGLVQAAVAEYTRARIPEGGEFQALLLMLLEAKTGVMEPRRAATKLLLNTLLNNRATSYVTSLSVIGKDLKILLAQCLEGDSDVGRIIGLLFYQRPSSLKPGMDYFLRGLANKQKSRFREVFPSFISTNPTLTTEWLQSLRGLSASSLTVLVGEYFGSRSVTANRSWRNPAWTDVFEKMVSASEYVELIMRLTGSLLNADTLDALLHNAFLSGQCTERVTSDYFSMHQATLYCRVCNLTVCIPCLKCHVGHETIRGVSEPYAKCQCATCSPAITKAIRDNVCTFVVTKREFIPQQVVNCITCGLVDNLGCCMTCATRCHAGHTLGTAKFSPGFYCDCGADRPECQALKPSFSSSMSSALPIAPPAPPHRTVEAESNTGPWQRLPTLNNRGALLPEPFHSDQKLEIRPEEMFYDVNAKVLSVRPSGTDQYVFQSLGLVNDGEGKPEHTSFYFEAAFTGEQVGLRAVLAVGLSQALQGVTGDLLGFKPDQWGYHGDDGKIYFENQGKDYAIGYECGDTIGCGLLNTGFVYFTKNGLFLGISDKKVPPGLAVFATVSIRSWAVTCSFRFTEPFMFTGARNTTVVDISKWPESFSNSVDRQALQCVFGYLPNQAQGSGASWNSLLELLSKSSHSQIISVLYFVALFKSEKVVEFALKFPQVVARIDSERRKTPLSSAVWKVITDVIPKDLAPSPIVVGKFSPDLNNQEPISKPYNPVGAEKRKIYVRNTENNQVMELQLNLSMSMDDVEEMIRKSDKCPHADVSLFKTVDGVRVKISGIDGLFEEELGKTIKNPIEYSLAAFQPNFSDASFRTRSRTTALSRTVSHFSRSPSTVSSPSNSRRY